ncbi:MAG: cation:proton antiporter [Planctomycetia bacterium]|nr:cation:proton antiporter [Planctomycetia bacterium]
MTSHEFVRLLVELSVMLACALAGGRLMRRFRQPAVLGEMLAGIVLGPTIVGAFAPEWQERLFSEAGTAADVRDGVIKLGMLFFLFVVGLEIDLTQLWKHGWTAFLIGTIGTAVPLASGVALAYALPASMLPCHVPVLPFGLFLGACLANSANPVLARILLDLGLLRQNIGAVLMTATVVDDLVGWSLLAIILGNFDGDGNVSAGRAAITSVLVVVGVFVALLFVGRFVAMPLLRRARQGAWPVGFIGVAVVLILLSAAVAEYLGIHAFLGPFLLGLALAPTPKERHEAYEVLNHFALSFFVPVYFVSMGLHSDFIKNFDAAWVASILLAACASKIASTFAAARMAGLDARTSLAVGFGMNARGATGIILAGVGLENHVIDQPVYVALVIMALATSLAAGPLMKSTLRIRGEGPAKTNDDDAELY